MDSVTIRDLRNLGGRVIDRVVAGEELIVTRSGAPVAELRPVARIPLRVEALLARRHRLAPVDPKMLRDDIDRLIDPSL